MGSDKNGSNLVIAAAVSNDADENPSYTHDIALPVMAGCTSGVHRSQRHRDVGLPPLASSAGIVPFVTAKARIARGVVAIYGQLGAPNAEASQHKPLVDGVCSSRNSK